VSGWRLLLDENIDPKTATYLEKEGIHTEHVRDALWQGADDEVDVLPYAREHELIVVTSDVNDFGGLPPDGHAGIVLLYDDTMPAYQVAAGLITMTAAVPGVFIYCRDSHGMFDRILFPTDGGEGADAVFDRVLDVAETHGGTVHVLNVADTTHDSVTRIQGEIIDVLEHEGETVVEAAAERAAERGVPTVTDVVQGGVAATVEAYAAEYGIDLVAIPTRGRTGLERLFLGSTTDRVLRRSSVPVLTLDPADDATPYPARNVLVPTDGSAGAEGALGVSTELAAETGAALHVLCIVDESDPGTDVSADAAGDRASETVEKAVSVAEDAGVESVVGTVETAPSIRRAIESYVGTHDVGLVVMGTRGRRGLERRLLGSVTERIVRSASVPVVAVPESRGER